MTTSAAPTANGSKGKDEKESSKSESKRKVDPLLRAASQLIKSHATVGSALEKLGKVRKEWNKKIKDARNALADALTSARGVGVGENGEAAEKLRAMVKLNDDLEAAKNKKKLWDKKVNEAKAALETEIERPINIKGASPDVSAAIDGIAMAQQDLTEKVAGKKAAIHLVLNDWKEKVAKLAQQIEGAKQLKLFN